MEQEILNAITNLRRTKGKTITYFGVAPASDPVWSFRDSGIHANVVSLAIPRIKRFFEPTDVQGYRKVAGKCWLHSHAGTMYLEQWCEDRELDFPAIVPRLGHISNGEFILAMMLSGFSIKWHRNAADEFCEIAAKIRPCYNEWFRGLVPRMKH
ncbi:MAG: hypothetical protein P4L69_03150 [Desulfosporosinus sp.]|nr:hypothetical protein [Desulfosporosinus sp.]